MRASAVKPRPVDWLWFPFVPLGKITVLAGQMGQAKSLATCWLAAAVTRGEGITYGRPGSVIVLNAEDDAEDTIRPRLEAAGADLNRVWIEPGVELDAVRLAAICDDMVDVRGLFIDPISAYLPSGVNSWKSQDVRAALEPIRQLAVERKLAPVLVQHLNRRTDAGDPLSRIADSQGIPQLARSVLVWGPDPSDPEGDRGAQKVLTRAKGNLARAEASATFVIVEKTVTAGIKAPTLQRGADREITADDVIADHDTRTAIDEAAEWLRGILAAGPVPAKDVTKQAREVGISDSTLKRAKRTVGVESKATRDEANEFASWTWALRSPIKTLDPLDHMDPLDPQWTQKAQKTNTYEAAPNGRADDPEVIDWAERLLARHADVAAEGTA